MLAILVALGAQPVFESVIWLHPMLLVTCVIYLIYMGLSIMSKTQKRNKIQLKGFSPKAFCKFLSFSFSIQSYGY
jgi:threonine/homoserine/homoserine lactone efflux protein